MYRKSLPLGFLLSLNYFMIDDTICGKMMLFADTMQFQKLIVRNHKHLNFKSVVICLINEEIIRVEET